jgi:aspartate/glutamate racemase
MTSNMVFGEKNVGVIGGMGPDATADTLAPYRKKIETALSKKGTNKTKIPSLEKDVHKK